MAKQGAQSEGWMGHEGVKPDVLGMFDMAGKVASMLVPNPPPSMTH